MLLRPLATNPEVVRYISNGEPWPDERIREWAGRQVAHFAKFGFCFWKLIHKDTGEMIGFCGLQPVALEGLTEIEIGWWLAPAWWGQGLRDGSSARSDARRIRTRGIAADRIDRDAGERGVHAHHGKVGDDVRTGDNSPRRHGSDVHGRESEAREGLIHRSSAATLLRSKSRTTLYTDVQAAQRGRCAWRLGSLNCLAFPHYTVGA